MLHCLQDRSIARYSAPVLRCMPVRLILFRGLSEDRLEEAAQEICKHLNVGHGDMQVRSAFHTSRSIVLKEIFEGEERILGEDMTRFFKLFKESTFEGSQAAVRKMKEIAKRQDKHNQRNSLFHTLQVLIRSDSKILLWPNSPLLVLLQLVGPNILSGRQEEALQERETRLTPLHHLAELADLSDYSTHENQLILAKQLIEGGANINAVSIPQGGTPFSSACHGNHVTNLDYIELLLKEGAYPNFKDHQRVTPLMCTNPDAPGAAKFLLNWPTTDVSMTTRSGASFLAKVCRTIKNFSNKVALPDNPDRVQHQFLLQQWREIEKMLVKRSAADRDRSV